MPSLSHPLRSWRLALALAVVCGLSFTGWRVSASETNGSWLIRLKHVPAAVWVAMFQANPETVSQSGLTTDGNRARSAAQRSLGLASALPPALRDREALDDLKQPGLSDAPLPTAFAPLAPAMTGCATPSFGATTNFGVGNTPASIAISDFNSDGKLDLAVANFVFQSNTPGNVSVLLGTGTGSFGAPTNFTVGTTPFSIAMGDLNADGKLDLAVANAGSNNISVLLGMGTGSFDAATNFGVGAAPVSVAIGDLNGDGKPDLATANNSFNNVSVLLGTGTGSFGAATRFGVGTRPNSVAIGDLNGDGKPDLATANLGSSNVSVLLGNSFNSRINFGVGFIPYSVAIGDLNSDGKPDLAVTNLGSDNISVLLGTGTGNFGAATNFGVQFAPIAVAIGDLNGDGKLDLAVANSASDNVSVLLNNCLANTAPILTPIAATRQQGSPVSNSQIATAADAQDAANTLQIQLSSDGVNFGNTATAGGVTVTLTDSNAGAVGTNPDATGKVFADIVAACAASNASFTFKVTDSGALTATATLTVTVNANAAPTVGNYTNTTVAVGGTVTITPDAVPLDNGTIASVTATAVPSTFTGTFSGNTVTGAVTVTNASPSGTYAITVTVTDNCGTTVSKQFMLTVATPVVGGSLADPLNCTGTGSVVNVTATVSNTSGAAQAATLSAALPAQLLALPGTCQASSGTCAINNPASVTWSGSLANGQTATITYQAQLADGVPAGTQVCVTSTASFTGGGSANVTACRTLNCPSSGPGALYPAASALNDQKPGSVLLFNLYTSDAAAGNQQNTRIALTNTDALRTAYVHLFFVDGASCAVADSFVCLTPNQTAAFLASDIDPGTTGYVIAVATDRSGCPINFNFLLGDAFVKLSSGHAANLPAESVAALPGGFVPCDPLASTAVLNFDDRMYNALPRTLALSNIASRADGNNTLLIVNRLGGNLATSASTLANLFGVLYDDAETPFSFSFAPGTCQFRSLISSNFPRTTPRFEQVIPAGRSGWLKLALFTEGAISGAAINANTNAGTQANAFNQGHNLHKLTLTTATTLTVPVFPPGC